MKRLIFSILSIAISFSPIIVSAQSNVKSAFYALIKSRDVKITENHQLEKNPSTLEKVGQIDEYLFVLPVSKKNLITNIIAAFDKDSDKAYGLYGGKTDIKDQTRYVVAAGDGTGKGVQISEPGHDYMYALFLAPKSEDPEGIYRYAYAIHYKENDGEIVGKLVVTYATTLQYRQQLAQEKENALLSRKAFSSKVDTPAGSSWFNKVMIYLQGLPSSPKNTRMALASKAYSIILDTSHYKDVKNSEKRTVMEIIKALMSDPDYSDPLVDTILNQCLIELSK